MSPIDVRVQRPMSSAVALSLGLHLAALPFVALPGPAAPVQVVVIETRLIAPETPPKPPPAPPRRAVVITAANPIARPADTPLLAGGAAMSDEDEVAVSQSASRPASSPLATSHAHRESAAAASGGGAEAGGGGGEAARATGAVATRGLSSAAPARTRQADSGGGGGQAGGGEQASAHALAGTAAPRALDRAVAGGGMARPAAAAGATSSEAGAGLAAGATTARPVRLGAVAPAAALGATPGAAAPALARPGEARGQRIDLAHAGWAGARLTDESVRASAARSSGNDRGAEPSGPGPMQRHPGPPNTLVHLAAAPAASLDFNAIPSASNKLFQAALAADGDACFRYSSLMRRQHLEGLVVLRVRVNRDGRAERIEVKQGSGDAALDAAALEQAQGCARFVLRDRQGRPVAASVDLPIRYRFTEDY